MCRSPLADDEKELRRYRNEGFFLRKGRCHQNPGPHVNGNREPTWRGHLEVYGSSHGHFFGLRTLSAAPGWISRTDPRVDESEAFRKSGRTYVLVKGGAVAMSSCQRALLLGVADPLVG